MTIPQTKTSDPIVQHEQLFQQHLQSVFGKRSEEFSVNLLKHLQELWLKGLETRTGDDMKVNDLLIPVRVNTSVTVQETSSATPEQPGSPLRYPAKVGNWSPEWPASGFRDQTRPPCSGCGGRGLGDYPHPCNLCGGTGNG